MRCRRVILPAFVPLSCIMVMESTAAMGYTLWIRSRKTIIIDLFQLP